MARQKTDEKLSEFARLFDADIACLQADVRLLRESVKAQLLATLTDNEPDRSRRRGTLQDCQASLDDIESRLHRLIQKRGHVTASGGAEKREGDLQADFPSNVRRWVNVADRDDFIATEPDLKGLFGAGVPAGAMFEAGYTVDNGANPAQLRFLPRKGASWQSGRRNLQERSLRHLRLDRDPSRKRFRVILTLLNFGND